MLSKILNRYVINFEDNIYLMDNEIEFFGYNSSFKINNCIRILLLIIFILKKNMHVSEISKSLYNEFNLHNINPDTYVEYFIINFIIVHNK